MIREALENFQITPNLTENIMREISRLKPIAPPGGKPLAPWAIGVSTIAVIFLILGVGMAYLSRFQKPYSFDATSEMTIEIIEAPIVLDLESKPDVRTQIGGAAAPSQNDGAGQQPDDVLFAAAQADGENVSVSKQQWIQSEPINGAAVQSLFATPGGDLYTHAKVPVEIPMTKSHREQDPRVNHIVKSGGVIYAGVEYDENGEKVRLYRVSADDRTFVPIQGMPFFDSGELKRRLPQNLFVEKLQERYSGATQFFKDLVQADNRKQNELIRMGLRGTFAVSGDTFYMEYNYKLFRWTPSEAKWHDTGVEETNELSIQKAAKAFEEAGMPREKAVEILSTWKQGFKLAVSGNTVYVGKRDSRLVASFDKGNNWLDLTPALPFPVKAFYDTVFVGSTVYVATDAGVAASSDGKQWHTITDAAGTPLIIRQLAIDGTKVYGVSKLGIYRLENNAWKVVVPEIPNSVTSLAVDGNVLYVGTQGSGILHFSLDE